MAINSDGLADFGTGAFAGASTGAKISGGNPYATAAGGLFGGAISYFGGAGQRKIEGRVNAQALELGDLNVSESRRRDKAERERMQRKELFGQMLAQYFQQQGAK